MIASASCHTQGRYRTATRNVPREDVQMVAGRFYLGGVCSTAPAQLSCICCKDGHGNYLPTIAPQHLSGRYGADVATIILLDRASASLTAGELAFIGDSPAAAHGRFKPGIEADMKRSIRTSNISQSCSWCLARIPARSGSLLVCVCVCPIYILHRDRGMCGGWCCLLIWHRRVRSVRQSGEPVPFRFPERRLQNPQAASICKWYTAVTIARTASRNVSNVF